MPETLGRKAAGRTEGRGGLQAPGWHGSVEARAPCGAAGGGEPRDAEDGGSASGPPGCPPGLRWEAVIGMGTFAPWGCSANVRL